MGVPGESALQSAIAAECVDKLRNTYLPWIERSIVSLDRDTIWRRPRPGVNSIGILMLHLAGNVRQWVHHGVDNQPDHRDRDGEFASEDGEEGTVLLSRLQGTVSEACSIISKPRSESEWLQSITIQGFSTTPLGAIIHVTEHFSYHTGQIVLLAKIATGEDFRFYNL